MGFFGRERSSRGRDPGVPSRSSRKLRLDRDSDADVHLHPSSRQARLLKAQQGGSRRSGIAAHSSRNMSRAARAEEKIRLLDGIGGPGGATYSPPETATPSSLAKRARDAAPSFARVALLLALVAAVFVIAARPDIITAGRILAADALARALAGRADAPVAARAREAVPEATVPGPRPRPRSTTRVPRPTPNHTRVLDPPPSRRTPRALRRALRQTHRRRRRPRRRDALPRARRPTLQIRGQSRRVGLRRRRRHVWLRRDERRARREEEGKRRVVVERLGPRGVIGARRGRCRWDVPKTSPRRRDVLEPLLDRSRLRRRVHVRLGHVRGGGGR